jgi:membrane fusion protein (multidrug efflux system)
LVGQGEATQLALVQQIDPLYLNFTQSTTDVLRLRKALDSGRLKAAGGPGAARVHVVLEDGSDYPLPGRLLFSDLSVDASTGQITLRAEVPNPKGLLLPGLYVRARLEQAEADNAITLPQQAVSRGPTGDSVLVVGADGKVQPRKVTVGSVQGGEWVILGGLQAGEQVMVDGFQKLRGGAPVKPVPWTPHAAASTASGAAAGAAPASTSVGASAAASAAGAGR